MSSASATPVTHKERTRTTRKRFMNHSFDEGNDSGPDSLSSGAYPWPGARSRPQWPGAFACARFIRPVAETIARRGLKLHLGHRRRAFRQRVEGLFVET